MLSSVLNRPRAVAVNIALMCAFIRLREMAQQFHEVFKAIRELITPPEPPNRQIGFHL